MSDATPLTKDEEAARRAKPSGAWECPCGWHCLALDARCPNGHARRNPLPFEELRAFATLDAERAAREAEVRTLREEMTRRVSEARRDGVRVGYDRGFVDCQFGREHSPPPPEEPPGDLWLNDLVRKMTYESPDAEETRRRVATLRPRLDGLNAIEWRRLDMAVRAVCCRVAAPHQPAHERDRLLLVAKLCEAQAGGSTVDALEYDEAQGERGAASPRAHWASCWAYALAMRGGEPVLSELRATVLATLAWFSWPRQ